MHPLPRQLGNQLEKRERHGTTGPATQTLHPDTTPEVVDRSTWQNARDDLLAREKAHTREGGAIAAARRRLPMTQIPDDATVEGSNGQVPFLDVFEDRRTLFATSTCGMTGHRENGSARAAFQRLTPATT